MFSFLLHGQVCCKPALLARTLGCVLLLLTAPVVLSDHSLPTRNKRLLTNNNALHSREGMLLIGTVGCVCAMP